MTGDRRVAPDRAVIDDSLFVLRVGQHTKACAICDTLIAGGEARWVPVRHWQRKKMIRGRHTRLCVACVDARVGPAERSAAA